MHLLLLLPTFLLVEVFSSDIYLLQRAEKFVQFSPVLFTQGVFSTHVRVKKNLCNFHQYFSRDAFHATHFCPETNSDIQWPSDSLQCWNLHRSMIIDQGLRNCWSKRPTPCVFNKTFWGLGKKYRLSVTHWKSEMPFCVLCNYLHAFLSRKITIHWSNCDLTFKMAVHESHARERA